MLKLSSALVFSCLLASSPLVVAESALEATLHKDPLCGCCNAYADYLEEHGISVTRVDHGDMWKIKKQLGTDQAPSCHTVELNGYVIEGHVPISAVHKLLKEKPEINGISVPDMPINSPGMGPEIPGTLPVLTLGTQGQVLGEYGRF